MEKLKEKIFWVIFSILTIFLFSILCIFNYQDYQHEKTTLQDNLRRIENRESIEPIKPSELDKNLNESRKK